METQKRCRNTVMPALSDVTHPLLRGLIYIYIIFDHAFALYIYCTAAMVGTTTVGTAASTDRLY